VPNLWNSLFIYISLGFRKPSRMLIIPIGTSDQFITTGIMVLPIITGRIWMFPIKSVRIVKAEFHTIFAASLCYFGHGVTMKRRLLYTIKIGILRIIHCKAVMMLGCNDKVVHPGFFCCQYPLFCIKMYRIELLCQS